MARPNETYIGDGVYVYTDQYGNVVMFTSNGVTEKNHIHLEPDMMEMLFNWWNQRRSG